MLAATTGIFRGSREWWRFELAWFELLDLLFNAFLGGGLAASYRVAAQQLGSITRQETAGPRIFK